MATLTKRPPTDRVWQWLDAVPDPEIPVISVVDLGIVRDVEWRGDDTLVVTITPTYSGCPATRVIGMDIETALAERGIDRVTIEQRLSPAWTTDWMSEKGRKALTRFGIAPPHGADGPRQCPHCGSAEVERISQFGSTPCKALWRCTACLEPFDYFKCI